MNRKLFLLVIVLLAAVALPASWAAADPAATSASFIPGEPNDTFATANDAFEGYLMTSTDVDYLRFELEESTWIRPGVGIDHEWDNPALLRVELAVFDSTQTLLAEDTDCDENIHTPAIEADAGLYYFRVRACNGYFDSDQVYNVYVETFEAFEREPNDSFATAQLIDLSDSTFGLFSTSADLDYYRIELQSATLLSYSVQSRSSASSGRFKLALYDVTHTVVAEDADCNYSTELETPVGPGTHFLSVQPCTGTPDNSDLYVLHVYGEPLEVEPNDSFAVATPVALGGYVRGFLPVPADRDYYRFDVPAPLWFSSNVYFVDVTLALYDAAYTELARTAGSLGLYLPPGTYYLLVEPQAGTETDEAYQLNLHWLPYEVEPNNGRATATVMVQDSMAGAIQLAGDIDFYRFEGQARSRLHVGVSAGDSTLNPEVALLAADGTVLASDSNPDCLFFCYADLDYELSADAAYFLRIRSVTHPVGVGDYTVEIRESPNESMDVEPNNTPAQAVPAAYGDSLRGYFSDTDTIDYYRFAGRAGDQIILASSDVSSYWYGTFSLYDPALNPVPLNTENGWRQYTLWAELPTTGDYLVKVTPSDAYYGDGGIDYDRVLTLTGGDEPNNTRATATDITYGPLLNVTHDYLCDTDWFRFQGRAGDVLADINKDTATENVHLYAADGTQLWSMHVLPADGVYYLEVRGYSDDKWDTYCEEGQVTYPFGQALWVSAAVDGLGGNAAIKRGDIATRKNAAGQWQIVFDASDVGITQNVDAFEALPNGSIVMSLAGPQTVPGLGKVMPQDIIRFVPSALGDTTAGTFQWFLDGSDVGLTTSGEKIDAIYYQSGIENPLRISTRGAGAVPRTSGGVLKFADEDLINLVNGVFGPNSAGTWRMGLDGSTVPGLKGEDISSATLVQTFPERYSQLLIGLDSAFTVSGTKGTPYDVLREGPWQLAVTHLTDKKMDGLGIGAAWMP